MIDNLLSSPTTRMLEQTLSFTEQRHNVLLNDIANSSTPGFVQNDLSVGEFQSALRSAIDRSDASDNGTYEPDSPAGGSITFQRGGSRVAANPVATPNSVAFHDRGVRSMEYLMSEMADNAMAHNMAAQFLKGRYDTLAKAISMKA